MALRKNKVIVRYTNINHVFPRNKNVSTKPHDYPRNLFFSVNKNLVYFWRVMFFLDGSCNISQNMTFWKEDAKNTKTSFFFERDHIRNHVLT